MKGPRPYSASTVEAARLLGSRIRLARKQRRWTVEQLAERVGVAHVTISKAERGDLSVAIGTVFEAAAVVGVSLFDPDPRRRSFEAGRVADGLALLPRLVRPTALDDDF
ncbi:MAG: helix-turn-helix transcriptional regulator [Acidimicrobiales bacterium]